MFDTITKDPSQKSSQSWKIEKISHEESKPGPWEWYKRESCSDTRQIVENAYLLRTVVDCPIPV